MAFVLEVLPSNIEFSMYKSALSASTTAVLSAVFSKNLEFVMLTIPVELLITP